MENNDYELIKWSKTFACGIKIIDDQHKGLINLVNDMFSHVTGNEETEKIYFDKVIHEVVRYIKVHFSTEEKILDATKFPGYIEHKKAHGIFILTVIENVHDYQSGKRYSLSLIAHFLKDWVLSHIAIMDKEYFEYVRKMVTQNEDGKLTVNNNQIYFVIHS